MVISHYPKTKNNYEYPIPRDFYNNLEVYVNGLLLNSKDLDYHPLGYFIEDNAIKFYEKMDETDLVHIKYSIDERLKDIDFSSKITKIEFSML